ncbi:unnamed protein product [Malus baccata var. baccata]
MSSLTEPITNKKLLHIALFPWLAFGHIIPALEVAKHIAQRGHKVSFISTPRNIQRLPKIPPNLTPLIDLVQIPLPRVENLPENAEATMDVPYDLIPYLKLAHDGLEQGITSFLQTHTPDWIIYDFAPYWLPPIASNLGISRAMFGGFNTYTACAFGPTLPDVLSRYSPRTLPEHFTVPPEWVPFPSKLFFRLFEAKKLFDALEHNASGISDWFRMKSTVEGSQVCLFRSCREIEGDWLDLVPELYHKPAIPVGLLPPSVQDTEDKEDSSWSIVCEWLDKRERATVVYVALGSEINPTQEEFTELALGLELSGLPFFWALRTPNGSAAGNSVKLPDEFEDRNKGRGLVWRTWAPQRQILAHKAVGGFWTHCGWSSLIEGIHRGIPLIMFPFLYDQGLNARLWDRKVGIEVPRNDEDGSFTKKEVAESLNLVMVDEEGKAYRDGAKEYSAVIADKDLHDRYMDKCVEYFEKNVHKV